MLSRVATLALAALLAACTVGPKYEEPKLDTPAKFDQSTAEATAEPAGSKLWSGFGNRELDTVITRALAANTTIAQSLARLNEARALSGLSVYSWFPTITASAARDRSQRSRHRRRGACESRRRDRGRRGRRRHRAA